ncbi:MAG: 23S rRNA (adenine(2503)-C(2))-methyltransferase RlmN [Chlamydiales bacterium]|nr:23S rRNA (adenine(2503)-C(2))-methyltransferase RlmN [Chlamydiia bacterium]MCP5506804.1 23S rRNA (adenine(2503)-C(2))-methyltransferase RlmN [Chlamydiales bacterium]
MPLKIVSNKKYAFDLSPDDWKAWLKENGYPAYAAAQIIGWVYQKGEINPECFSNISKDLRSRLIDEFTWVLPEVDAHLVSVDKSEKFLLKAGDGELYEMVLMPYENRVTLCISSQIGCRMGCTFCQTGKMGLKRNLSAGEILAQILLANRSSSTKKVTNIVFMGMGEPLDNYGAVLAACRMMVDPKAFGLSMHRVTVSTSGLVEAIDKLGKDLPVRLAISLHNADDAKRSEIMPVNRTNNLDTLKQTLLRYPAPKRYGITFEYVMIEGVNDSIADAKRLVSFLNGLKAKVNLIPINHFPGLQMQASAEDSLKRFQKYLSDRSIPAPIRYSRGQDISGGCGQLAAKRKDELDMDPRELHRIRRREARVAERVSQ